MTVQHITLLDDLLRDDYIPARNFIYTLIEEPIRQATNENFISIRKFPEERGLLAGFNLNTFRAHCGNRDWASSHHEIPSLAKAYLYSHIHPKTQVIGYEMPPWLINTLNEGNIQWIDIRISPIRFCRDLYLVMRDSTHHLADSLVSWQVSEEEILLEAGFMRASVLHNQPNKRHSYANLNGGVLFIGQTSKDASLISDQGTILSISDYKEEICRIVGNRNIFYKPHPYDRIWAIKEKATLESILKREVTTTKVNIYELLAGNIDFDMVSISSGTLQEADFFGRNSHMLFRPICNLDDKTNTHIRFLDFASPHFWSIALGYNSENLKVKKFPVIPENLMRKLHNTWWGYSEYMLENNSFWQQAFMHSMKEWILLLIEKLKTKAMFCLNAPRNKDR